MKIFDLHCDTIEALKKHNETFDNSTTQFTMKGVSYRITCNNGNQRTLRNP